MTTSQSVGITGSEVSLMDREEEPFYEHLGCDSFLIGPASEQIRDNLKAIQQDGFDGPHVRLLAHKSELDEALDDIFSKIRFETAVENGVLTARTVPRDNIWEDIVESPIRGENSLPMLALSETQLLVSVPPQMIQYEDDEVTERFLEAYQELFHEAEEYELYRASGINQIEEEAKRLLSDEFYGDFKKLFQDSNNLWDVDDSVGVAELLVVLAARHNEQQYHVGDFGENTDIVSSASISQAKVQLEEEGLITTTSVSVPVGRPRMRLTLADPLENLELPELVDKLGERGD